jgi:bifunctional non-homologous end joining protein LigD
LALNACGPEQTSQRATGSSQFLYGHFTATNSINISNERKNHRNMNTTLTAPQAQRITLYDREGSSDKVYQAAIEPQGEGFVVNFAYGRRGSTMNTGTKTQTPVDYDTATRIYEKLVNEKKAQGYTEGPDGTPYQNTPKEDRVTGLLPQLLNPIDEQEVKRLLKDPNWALQEKYDGRRVLLQKQGENLTAINRKGLTIGFASSIGVSAQKITSNFNMDGECVGDLFHAFDLLEWDGEDCRTKSYRRRLVLLSNLLNRPNLTHIRWVHTATDPANKERLFRHLQAERKEGVVFKRLDAPYTPGRPNSGGNQLKHKFYATCSAVVAQINDKRSIEVRLLNGKGWIACGNVTIPPNFNVPAVGDVVECRYLYAFKDSNALYQPVYLGPRKDVEHHECVLSQLKYKGQEEEDLC